MSSKFSYKFSNLCGAVYKQGNIEFSRDGNSVISPVGNRVSQFDLKNNTSCTLPFENQKNIHRFTVSPDGLLMISVDEDGRAVLVNLYKRVVLFHFNFKQPVYDIKYSPNGEYFAVTHGRRVQVWHAPGHTHDYSPFSLYRTFPGQYDDTVCLDWSQDSNFFAVGSRDTSCRVYSLHPLPGYHYVTLAAHRSALVACFFEKDSLNVYTVAKDGALCVWECSATLTEMAELVEKNCQLRRGKAEKVEPGGDKDGEDDDIESDDVAMDTETTLGKKLESSDDEQDDEMREAPPNTKKPKLLPNICQWTKSAKHLFNQDRARVTCATLHKPSSLLVVGFNSGIFSLYEMPEFNLIHSLSISQQRISSVAINCTGEWLAFGCRGLGQLLVWEWQSETYVLKQQGHFYDMNTLAYSPDGQLIVTGGDDSKQRISSVAINCTGEWLAFGCRGLGQLLVWEWQSETYILKQQGHFYDMNTLAYSPDGQLIVTGGDDSKVKLWNTSSGFCFVTFTEHSAAVTSVCFSASGKVVLSASLDGTVRAFDLHRYRNFRTFASPRPVQFSCLTLDPSGEVVCAGSHDTFEIFVWSMQTGRLLDLLSGHEGPVSSVSFCPSRSLLVSGSWDKTVRVWDVFEAKGNTEKLGHTADVVTLAFRPDGAQLAVSSLDGQISFWNVAQSVQTGSIEGRQDLSVGRREMDKVTAKKLSGGVYFTSLCYTADGGCVLAGGRSKFICLYHVAHQALLKKFQVSHNRSFDGMMSYLNSSRMTEAGPLDEISGDEEEERSLTLPGVRKGDMSSRKTKPEIRVKSVQFSPTGRAWAAVSTEGLLIYSLDKGVVFDPYDLSIDVTPEGVSRSLAEGKFSDALMMSFRLNETELIVKSVEAIPIQDIPLIVQHLPEAYIEKLLTFLAQRLDTSPHLQFYLSWCVCLLTSHCTKLKEQSSSLMAPIRDLQKSVAQKKADLGKICASNSYMLQYTLVRGQAKHQGNTEVDNG